MDEFITKASNQAVSFAIRSGISLASGYAIRTVSKFVEKIPEKDKAQLNSKIRRVRLQINIVNPSIELIKSVNASGFSSLQSCNELIDELTDLFKEFEDSVELWTNQLGKSNTTETIKLVNKRLDSLIELIDNAVPLLNLCIVSSGINFNRNLNDEVSVNKLLEASNLILSGRGNTEIGPVFDLKFYSVFYNPSRLKYVEEDGKETTDESPVTWKEEFARCKVQVKAGGDFAYDLIVTENFDDDRYHEGDPTVKTIRGTDIRKMFFSRSGKLLRLDNNNSAVLILKLESEYVAFGLYEALESDDESDDESEEDEEENIEYSHSLSLLEYLLRLCVLELNEKKPLTEITDEKLMIYLNNEIPKKENVSEALDMNSNLKRLENLKID